MGTKTLDALLDLVSAERAIAALLLLLLAWLASAGIRAVATRLAAHLPKHRSAILGITPLLRLVFWIAALVGIVLGVLRPSDALLLTIVAAVALAIGISAKDELKNLVGGLIVLIRKPFRMGDLISSGGYYGEVVSIRPSCTILRTFEDSIVTIPNAAWITKPVLSSNAGELGALVTVTFALPADRDAREVVALAEEAAHCCPYVKLDEPIYVSMKTEHERLILAVFTLKAYVFDVRFEPAMRTDILQRLFAVLRARGLMPALAEYDAA